MLLFCVSFDFIGIQNDIAVGFFFSHFWNNRTSRGKAAVLNPVVFYSSIQINPLQAEVVELLLCTGLAVW